MSIETAARVRQDVEILMRDGVTGLKGAFPVGLIDDLRADMEAAFEQAIGRPDGAVGRGPERWYVEVHPEDLRAFATIASHPWVQAMSESVLGPDYKFVEVGFDVPFRGARPALASRLSLTSGDLARPAADVTRVQPDRR